VFDRNGKERGSISLRSGKIAGCEALGLRGLDALCQLVERARAGGFRLEPGVAAPNGSGGDAFEVLPALFEAIRRHDGLAADRALVPDGTTCAPGPVPPSLPPGEDDQEFVRAVWKAASTGTPPERCEGSARADAYRVRRLYAVWLEQGALVVRRGS